jgi:hypothetical protein
VKTIFSESVAERETQMKARGVSSRDPFPDDLRVWLPAHDLLQLAHTVAQDNSGDALHPVFALSARRFHHPWRMLALVLYGYGSGVWNASDLATLTSQDPYLLELCRGEAPSGDMLRRFRNQNRSAVIGSLEKMLRRAWCHRHDHRASALPPFLIMEIHDDAQSRLQRATRCDERPESFSFAT